MSFEILNGVGYLLIRGIGMSNVQCASCGHAFDPLKDAIGFATPSPRAPHGGICCAKCGHLVAHNLGFRDMLKVDEPTATGKATGYGDEFWFPPYTEGA